MTRLTARQVDTEHRRLRKDRLKRYRADSLTGRVRWVAVCDGQTCEQCLGLHDQVIALNDARWPSLLHLHYGCRCRFTWNLPIT